MRDWWIRLVNLLRWLDAALGRRRFCFACDRQTFREHNGWHHRDGLALLLSAGVVDERGQLVAPVADGLSPDAWTWRPSAERPPL